jgi:hypothetical protein
MSGVRSYSFREGDRSEYLAQFFLSAMGLCTSIPRQEDIGFDFSCSIADQEAGLLTFGFPYLISIKSISAPSIEIEPSAAAIQANDHRHVSWLFRQDQPVFLGAVDKDAMNLRIFSLLPLWFLYYEGGPSIGTLSLNPRLNAQNEGDVGRPVRGEELANWPAHFHYDVDLGHPVAILDIPTIQDQDRLRAAKRFLRMAVDFSERNLLHYRLQIPDFYWFPKTSADASLLQPGFYYQPVQPTEEARQNIMSALAPSLISFALHFKQVHDAESLDACAKLLAHAPAGTVPQVVLDQLPELH